MLSVAICDSSAVFIERLSQRVMTSLKELGIPVAITTFTSGQSLLDHKEDIDLLFIEVEMPEMSGFEVAKEMKQLHRYDELVFVSEHKPYAFQSFRYQPLNFILKPETQERVDEIIIQYTEEFKRKYRRDIKDTFAAR